MKFLRSWIEEHIDLSSLSTEDLSNLITNHSSEVEDTAVYSDYFGGFVRVGKIANARKHENADTLTVFDVLLGDSKVTIVSAAPNVRDGIYVPVALSGAKIPGMTIADRPMRGITSQGMCCGKSELMLEAEFSSGLWELEGVTDEDLGVSICTKFPELFPKEELLDIKVLPDRIGNIGNYIGIALEIAHILGKPELLKGVAKQVQLGQFGYTPQLQKDTKYTISFKDTTGLSEVFDLFRARIDSEYVLPTEIKKRLFLAGVNMVNPLADLSNYIMYQTGQPIHFFSSKKVFKDETHKDWSIQEVTSEEPFVGLGNLKSTVLKPGMFVLKDGDTTLTIPALTGGESTKVTEEDLDIIVEIPCFDSNLTMKNSFTMKYRSEGAKIWASRSHPTRIAIALNYITQLLLGSHTYITLSTQGTTDTRSLSDHFKSFETPFSISVDWDYIGGRWDKQESSDLARSLTPHLTMLGIVTGNLLSVINQA
jgi:phenylalanyl-tRNA synthetase beta chain